MLRETPVHRQIGYLLQDHVWKEKSNVAWRLIDLCDLIPMPPKVNQYLVELLGVGGFWGPGTWIGLIKGGKK